MLKQFKKKAVAVIAFVNMVFVLSFFLDLSKSRDSFGENRWALLGLCHEGINFGMYDSYDKSFYSLCQWHFVYGSAVVAILAFLSAFIAVLCFHDLEMKKESKLYRIIINTSLCFLAIRLLFTLFIFFPLLFEQPTFVPVAVIFDYFVYLLSLYLRIPVEEGLISLACSVIAVVFGIIVGKGYVYLNDKKKRAILG